MAKTNIPVTKIHSYNVSVAADVGINAAVIFYNICYWVEENTANERNFINGEYWTYNTVNAFKTLFPEMSYEQVRNALRKLENAKYIKSAFLNDDTRDRTKWYTVVDKNKWITSNKCNCENSQMDCDKSQMEREENTDVNNIYNNKNTNTDNKQSNNNQSDNSHDKYALEDVKRPSSKGDMYAFVPEEHKDAQPKKKSRYIPKDYDEEQLMGHIKPIAENEVKQYIKDWDVNFPDDTSETFADILCLFCRKYKQHFGENHYIMPDKTLVSTVRRYLEPPEEMDGAFSLEEYEELIDLYFKTNFNRRGNYDKEIKLSFPHFMSDTIRGNLANRLWK